MRATNVCQWAPHIFDGIFESYDFCVDTASAIDTVEESFNLLTLVEYIIVNAHLR